MVLCDVFVLGGFVMFDVLVMVGFVCCCEVLEVWCGLVFVGVIVVLVGGGVVLVLGSLVLVELLFGVLVGVFLYLLVD